MRICAGRCAVFENVEERIVLAFYERCVHRDVTSSNAKRRFHFVGRDFEQEATVEQVSQLRAFARDLSAALA